MRGVLDGGGVQRVHVADRGDEVEVQRGPAVAGLLGAAGAAQLVEDRLVAGEEQGGGLAVVAEAVEERVGGVGGGRRGAPVPRPSSPFSFSTALRSSARAMSAPRDSGRSPRRTRL